MSITEDSKYCYNSTNVNSSSYIINSKDITFSKQISNSEQVKNSTCVRESKIITNSTYISNSENVRESSYVLNSNKIIECAQVNGSSSCYYSCNLIGVTDSADSYFCYESSDLTDCIGVGFSKDCHSCLFSSHLEGKSYYLFNKPVSPNRFMEIKEIMTLKFGDLWEKKGVLTLTPDFQFKATRSYGEMFDVLGADFFGWVGSLEEYDEGVFMMVFFHQGLKSLK